MTGAELDPALDDTPSSEDDSPDAPRVLVGAAGKDVAENDTE